MEGHSSHPTPASIGVGPVLEEPSQAELPPRSGGLTEVWVRSSKLPADLEMAKKVRQEEKDFMRQFGVTIPSSFEERHEQTGHDPVPTEWLD